MTATDDYDFALPEDLIAQHPLPERSASRLLVVDRAAATFYHKHIRDLPELLAPGDAVVLNDTRVVPARLLGKRTATGGAWEGLFLKSDSQGVWELLSQTRGKLQPGERVSVEDDSGNVAFELEMLARGEGGIWTARPTDQTSPDPLPLLECAGRVPLPPYIRHGQMEAADLERYQTVYARQPGSVAAPTAGLHLTESLLEQFAARDIAVHRLTLHVGIGTFRPMTADKLEDHVMHSEWGTISAEVAAALNATRQCGGRVVSIGTTSVRVLETAAASGQLAAWTGSTELFIRPGFQFHAVDALLTNFHLPKSTLLVLVRTFGGDDLICRAYEEAVRERYRFFSYGDAMLIL